MDIEQIIDSMTPEVYQRLATAVELGKWPDGVALTPEQKENSLQLVMLWQARYNTDAQHMTIDTSGQMVMKSKQQLKEEAVKLYEMKEAEFPEAEQLRELERVVLLKCIDSKWMDHIDDMEILRQGIGLVGYGQRDPVVEYKMNAFEMFNSMISSIQEDTVRMLYHVHVEQKIEREQVAKVTGTNKDDSAGPKKPVQRKEDKVYPNDPCPCGSGKKYKQCCGRKAAKI